MKNDGELGFKPLSPFAEMTQLPLSLNDSLHHSRTLLDAIPLSIAYIDRQQTYRFANRAYAEWRLMTPGQIEGQCATDILSPEIYNYAKDCFERALKGETFAFEAVVSHPSGDPRHISTSFVPDLDPEQKVRGFFVFLTDKTDLTRSHTKASHLHEAAAHLSRAADLASVRKAIANYALTAYGAKRGILVEFTDSGDTLEITESRGYPDSIIEPWKRFAPTAKLPLADCIRKKSAIYFETEVERENFYGEDSAREGTRAETGAKSRGALAAIPLIVNSKVIGAIGLSFDHERPFPTSARHFMESLATHCAEAMERARLFERVHSTQEQLALAIEASEMGIWDWLPKSNQLLWSASLQELYGLKPGEFRNSFEHYQELLHPEDRERINRTVQDSIDRKSSFDFIHRVLWPDGSTHWIHGRGKPYFDADGTLNRVTGTSINIDEKVRAEQALRASEERFRTLVDQTPFAFQLYSLDGLCTYANPAWERFWSAEREALKDYNILQDENLKLHDLNGEIQRAFRGERVTLPDVYYEPEKNGKPGRPRWIRTHFFPVKDDSGRMIEVAEILEDVSDGKALEDRTKELEQAIEVRDSFLSIASHELRTPVTSMKLQTQLMKRTIGKGETQQIPTERVERWLNQTERSLDRLNRLIEDMLDVSRIQFGRLSLTRETFDLSQLADEVLDRLHVQLDQAEIRVDRQLAPSALGFWDRHRLDQVLTNLLTNTIRYAPRKPVAVRVRMENDAAILEVADQGPGIAPENRERIFQRFERLVSANEISGMGLGLYIVKDIVESHGGEIRVESRLGEGSCFIVRLPFRPPQEN